MYLEHFGLAELPFSLTPDTDYFMMRDGHHDALNVLLVSLRGGEGFVKVTGEVGTGKTMLCRTLLKRLGQDFASAYLPNPYLRSSSLLISVADELGVEYPKRATQHQLMRCLTEALLALHGSGRRVVLCMDEAQAVPVPTLETLRLLTNLETEKRKLLQVVLFGQPELETTLNQPSIRQLRQRITFACELKPLARATLARYVAHRLCVAGHANGEVFERSALDALQAGSRGVPRLVNILAHKALLCAYGQGQQVVSRRHLREALADSADARGCRRQSAPGVLSWLRGLAGRA